MHITFSFLSYKAYVYRYFDITFHLINAMSPDDIPEKIRTKDYAYTQNAVLANVNNNTNNFLELTSLPVGEHYVFIETPTATGGNEALINFIGILYR